MNKVALYLIAIILSCSGVYLKFNSNLENIPIGCDEFGYLNLAKAMDKNIQYQNHVVRPYLPLLLDTLRKSGVTENEIRWMVVPYAYYVIPNSNQIINQYPPGTSYILSWFPFSMRRQVLPAISFLILLLIPLLISSGNRNSNINWLDISLIAFLFIMTLSIPFLTELGRVNSLAFTFGLLLGAGILLESKPLLSCCLIVLSANFRVVNLLMIVPLIAFVPLRKIIITKNLSSLLSLAGKYFIVLMLSLLPYLIYVFRLRGNPLLPTYAEGDTAINTNVVDNIIYYFNLHQPWFLFHLILIIASFLLFYFHKISFSFFLKLLLFPIINYLFFAFHKVQIDYYPYASSFILLGACLGQLNEIGVNKKKTTLYNLVFIGLALVIFTDGFIRYKNTSHKSFDQAKSEYTALCNYNIVWGDLLSGTSEYVCDNSGFKYGASTPRARKLALQFLHTKKYTQAILLKDNLVDKSMVIDEVKKCGLNYHIINDTLIGEILVIE